MPGPPGDGIVGGGADLAPLHTEGVLDIPHKQLILAFFADGAALRAGSTGLIGDPVSVLGDIWDGHHPGSGDRPLPKFIEVPSFPSRTQKGGEAPQAAS